MSMKKQSDYAHLSGDDSAVFMTRREFELMPTVAEFTVDGQPVSKARARFTKYGSRTMVYTPEKTLQGERAVADAFKIASPKWEVDGDHIYGVFAIFFASSKQRRDIDNMMKLILDALNGVTWVDDAQVHEISAKKQFCPPGHERTAILIYRMGPKPQSYVKCTECKGFFITYPSWMDRSFCSSKCHEAATLRKRGRVCPQCGKDFLAEKTTSRTKYCSPACVADSKRVVIACVHCGADFSRQANSKRGKNFCGTDCAVAHKRANPVKVPKGTCQTCGAGVSRREYTTCAACHAEKVGIGGSPRPAEHPFRPDDIEQIIQERLT